jgi:hypothetical protein
MAFGDITSILSIMQRSMVTMRQSAKAKNIQEAEKNLLQNHYYEAQTALTDETMEEKLLVLGISDLPIKYIPRKMSR